MKESYSLTTLIKDKDEFYNVLDEFKNFILENYSQRKELVEFIYNRKKYSVYKSSFLIQLIFIIPFIENDFIKFNEEFLIIDELKNFNNSTVFNYCNKILKMALNLDVTPDDVINKLNKSFMEITNSLAEISGYANIYSGTTINLRDIFNIYENNKEFRDKFELSVPLGLDFSETEDYIKNQSNELIEMLAEDKNCYSPYFVAKTGINKQQFKEVISKIGLKADLDGNLINYCIDSNFIKGLRNITDFYIIALLTRKALITSHVNTKSSGWTLIFKTFTINSFNCWKLLRA